MFNGGILNFGKCRLNVGVCDTEPLRRRGLMGVKYLPQDCGMLFVMEEAGPVSFWMRNTLVPLDIAFLDKNLKVLGIDEMEPHTGKCSCRGPVKYAVETNRGWFQRNKIVPGCRVIMHGGTNEIKDFVNAVIIEMREHSAHFGGKNERSMQRNSF